MTGVGRGLKGPARVPLEGSRGDQMGVCEGRKRGWQAVADAGWTELLPQAVLAKEVLLGKQQGAADVQSVPEGDLGPLEHVHAG